MNYKTIIAMLVLIAAAPAPVSATSGGETSSTSCINILGAPVPEVPAGYEIINISYGTPIIAADGIVMINTAWYETDAGELKQGLFWWGVYGTCWNQSLKPDGDT